MWRGPNSIFAVCCSMPTVYLIFHMCTACNVINGTIALGQRLLIILYHTTLYSEVMISSICQHRHHKNSVSHLSYRVEMYQLLADLVQALRIALDLGQAAEHEHFEFLPKKVFNSKSAGSRLEFIK